MTRRAAGPYQTTRTRIPYVLPIGHLSTKSSVYSPVSMSRMSQDLVYNHMKSHYQRISSAKACVDTSAPKSMKLTIKEKDRRRKETLLASSIQNTSSRPSSRKTEASNSPRERRERNNSSTLNHNSINGNGEPTLGQTRKNDNRPRSSKTSRRHGKFSESYRENGDFQQPHYNQSLNDTDNFLATNDNIKHNIPFDENNYDRFQRTRNRIDKDKKPHADNSKGRNNETDTTIPDRSDLYASSQHNGEESSNLRNEALENGFDNNEYRTSDRLYTTSTPRFERQDDFEINPNLMTFSYKSPPTRRQRKKSAEKVIWTEEQKYLQFISDVTSDVLARGICSNRVINKVFESHIEKRKDDLDEENMREMINQLKEDLGVTDD